MHEGRGHFIGLHGGAAEISPGAEGAVETVPLAGRGEQGLEDSLAGAAGRAVDHAGVGFRCAANRGMGTLVQVGFKVHLIGQEVKLIK